VYDQFSIRPWSEADPARKSDRGGENKTVVVVSMVPNDVDPAWGAIQAGLAPKLIFKFLK
jgi:hypothetical protein